MIYRINSPCQLLPVGSIQKQVMMLVMRKEAKVVVVVEEKAEEEVEETCLLLLLSLNLDPRKMHCRAVETVVSILYPSSDQTLSSILKPYCSHT